MKHAMKLLLITLNAYASIHTMNNNPTYGLAHEIAKKHVAETNSSAQTATAAAPSPLKSHTQKQLAFQHIQRLPDDVIEEITKNKIALEQHAKRMYILRHQKELFPAVVQLADGDMGPERFCKMSGFKQWIDDSMRYCTINAMERLNWLNQVPGHMDKPKIVHYAYYHLHPKVVLNLSQNTPVDPFGDRARAIDSAMGYPRSVQPTQIVIAGFSDKTTAVGMNKEVLKSLAHNYSEEQLKFIVSLFNRPENVFVLLTDNEKALFQSLDQHIQKCLKFNYPWIDFNAQVPTNKKTKAHNVRPVIGLDERIELFSDQLINLISRFFVCKKKY